MWALRKQYIAAVAPVQSSNQTALAAYRDAIGQADSQAIIDYIKANAVVSVASVSGVTVGSASSGPGTGTISA